MQLTSILKTTAADWANLQVMTSIKQKDWKFGEYYYLQLATTVKYILNDIFVCIIKAESSNQEESRWKLKKGCQTNVNDRLCKINWLHIADTPKAKWVTT
jgi:hypothetical protein